MDDFIIKSRLVDIRLGLSIKWGALHYTGLIWQMLLSKTTHALGAIWGLVSRSRTLRHVDGSWTSNRQPTQDTSSENYQEQLFFVANCSLPHTYTSVKTEFGV